jgi:hypothetical protein
MYYKDSQKRHSRTSKWYVRNMYKRIKQRIRTNPHYKNRKLHFSMEEWLEFAKNNNYKELYGNYVASNRDMRLAPSIDRVDNSGEYTLDNIQIITHSKNASKDNKKIKFNGENKTIADWSKETGMSYSTIWQRLYTYGWTVEQTLTKPLGSRC